MTPTPDQIRTLPGGERMLEGLQGWRAGQTTISSCLVFIAFGKFRAAGLVEGESPIPEAELVSFGRALSRYQRQIP